MKRSHGHLQKKKMKQSELASVLAHLAETLRRVAILLKPFLTQTPEKIFAQLNITDEALKEWNSLAEFGQIPAGTTVVKGEPIFPRLEMQEEIEFIKSQMQGGTPKEKSLRKKRKQK